MNPLENLTDDELEKRLRELYNTQADVTEQIGILNGEKERRYTQNLAARLLATIPENVRELLTQNVTIVMPAPAEAGAEAVAPESEPPPSVAPDSPRRRGLFGRRD